LIACPPRPRFDGGHAERPVYPREIHQGAHGRKEAGRGILRAFPKDRYQTEVESWRELQSQNIEFTMKRLREPIERATEIAK
jgi:hypothetical protein